MKSIVTKFNCHINTTTFYCSQLIQRIIFFVFSGFAICLCHQAIAAPSDLDPVFNGNGYVFANSSMMPSDGQKLLLQPDGKIVVLSEASRIVLRRYLTNGELDTQFGVSGTAALPFGVGLTMVLQPDGKIIVAGGNGIESLLVRFLPSGSLDAAFGSGGVFTFLAGGDSSLIWSMALRSDGKIITAGRSTHNFQGKAYLTRHLQNGSLDTTFGTNGVTYPTICASPYSTYFFGLALQYDGKMLTLANSGSCLSRFLADGSVDPSFGLNGHVQPGILAGTLSVLIDGKILIGGHGNYPGLLPGFALERYLPDGSLDPSFGINGLAVKQINYDASIYGMAIGMNGSIVAVGRSHPSPSSPHRWTVTRFLPNGAPDPVFGTEGSAFFAFDDMTEAHDVRIQPDGKIVITGVGDAVGNSPSYFVIARLIGDQTTPSGIPTLSWHALALLTLSLGLLGVVYRKRKNS
jgi:uncharacterized delta-60 repeat protein